MHRYTLALCCVLAAPVLQAITVEEAAAALSAHLQREVDILAAVHDAASAEAAVQPLQNVLAELATLNGQVEDDALWNYIDSTEGMKPAIVTMVQNLARQFSRLEKEKFYGTEALHKALAPQLNPAAPKPAAH